MRFGGQITRTVIGLGFLLGLAGCSSLGFSSNRALAANGLPREKYLVGGGMHIQYVAPADGRLYWVERTTQKILVMKSVKAEEETEFGTEKIDPDAAKEGFGVDLRDAKFALYFVPDRE